MTEERVAELVENYIRDKRPGGATLHVVNTAIRTEEGWWYVPVKPDFQPVKRFEYFELLAETELSLKKRDGITVLLIPVWTDDTVTA